MTPTDIAEYVRPAVLAILDYRGNVNGTGFFITPDGYILTCYHVIENNLSANEVDVRMADGVQLKAIFEPEKSCQEKEIDFAILKVEGQGPFPYLPLSRNLRPGDKWSSLGYIWPSSYKCDSSCGTIFSMPPRPNSENYDIRLKTELPIRGGSSGSPLFNMKTGMVVGVIKSRPEEDGSREGFAVPMDDVFARWPELEKLISDTSRLSKLSPSTEVNKLSYIYYLDCLNKKLNDYLQSPISRFLGSSDRIYRGCRFSSLFLSPKDKIWRIIEENEDRFLKIC